MGIAHNTLLLECIKINCVLGREKRRCELLEVWDGTCEAGSKVKTF